MLAIRCRGRFTSPGAAGRVAMTKPLFLYLPHQAVHVGNPTEPSHPEYAPDQAPQEYIDRYSWVADEARRNLSAMVAVMVRQLRRAHVDIIWGPFSCLLSPFSRGYRLHPTPHHGCHGCYVCWIPVNIPK